MADSMRITVIGEPTQFTLEEACGLLNAHVVRKNRPGDASASGELGYIAGVVTLNDQIEILAKFEKELLQLNKRGVADLLEVLLDE